MIVNRDTLEGLREGWKLNFLNAMNAATPKYQRICTVVDSTSDKENYPYLGRSSMPRKWIDERVPQGIRSGKWEIENEKFELTLDVERTAIEDDRIGQYNLAVDDMGVRQAEHPDYLVTQLLNGAFTSACYDGDYLCGTNHVWGDSGTQVNYTNHTLSETYLQEAFTTMAAYVDDKGQPAGTRPNLLVVSPSLEFTARKLLNSTEIVPVSTSGGPNGNPLKDIMELLVWPGVTAGYWFAIDTTKAIKPFLFQWRIKPEFVGVTDPSDSFVFNTDVFKYGTRSRCGVGNGAWMNIYGGHA